MKNSLNHSTGNPNKFIIPENSSVFQQLAQVAKAAKVVALSGLPGTGKSLYMNQFKQIAESLGKTVTVIQWDVARKAFETPEIFARYPMGDGVVHNGVKLSVGYWLMDTLKTWLEENESPQMQLLIEAPLVGHRFIELAQIQADKQLESFLQTDDFQMIVPIPSTEVRAKIEADRRAQLADDATTWMGAKPVVMLQLWKMICGIANKFGRAISMEGQPAYDPEICAFVFAEILKNRHFVPLHINEVFDVSITNEHDLHQLNSLSADTNLANAYMQYTAKKYPTNEALNQVVNAWYLT